MGAGGGDAGDGVALVEDFIAGQHVVAGEAHTLVGVVHPGDGQVVDGNDGLDAGVRLGLGGVDGLDAGMGVGAAQDGPVEQAGHLEIAAVLGPAGNFVGAVVPDGAGAYHVIISIGQYDIGHNQSPRNLGLEWGQ